MDTNENKTTEPENAVADDKAQNQGDESPDVASNEDTEATPAKRCDPLARMAYPPEDGAASNAKILSVLNGILARLKAIEKKLNK